MAKQQIEYTSLLNEEVSAEQQAAYDAQKAVGVQPLHQTPAYTWLEMKVLGAKNQIVLMYDRFRKEDVAVPVVDVETGDGVWCLPEQVVRIGAKLQKPRMSATFTTKDVQSSDKTDVKVDKKYIGTVKQKGRVAGHVTASSQEKKVTAIKQKPDTFPFEENFVLNVDELDQHGTKYTDMQISRAINRMVGKLILDSTKGKVHLKEGNGFIAKETVPEGMATTYYLDGSPAKGMSLGETAYAEAAPRIVELFKRLGLLSVTYKSKSITLTWMSRSDYAKRTAKVVKK
jgi:hypothetical protein